jgi:hypothetical protein
MGVLVATGMIVGESLWGVAFAGIVYGTDRESPLALPFIGDAFAPVALIGGVILFVAVTAWLYSYAAGGLKRMASVKVSQEGEPSPQNVLPPLENQRVLWMLLILFLGVSLVLSLLKLQALLSGGPGASS